MRQIVGMALLFLIATGTVLSQESARNQKADEAAVKAVTAGSVDAWNRHDMRAFAALFAQDADFVNVIGMWWRGRAEIQKEHETLHATRMKNTRLMAAETVVRFLRPDVAVVHVRWEITGETGSESKILPPRKGILMYVVAKIGDDWLVTAAQNTDILELPKPPTQK